MVYMLDELDDDALSDGGEDDLTPEQQGILRYYVLDGIHALTIRS
jgi:hypothetical protein